MSPILIEEMLGNFNDHQIKDYDAEDGQKRWTREAREAERFGDARIRDEPSDNNDAYRAQQERHAGPAFERKSPASDDVHDQGLAGDGFHEPTRLESAARIAEDGEKNGEGNPVEDGTYRSEYHHKFA